MLSAYHRCAVPTTSGKPRMVATNVSNATKVVAITPNLPRSSTGAISDRNIARDLVPTPARREVRTMPLLQLLLTHTYVHVHSWGKRGGFSPQRRFWTKISPQRIFVGSLKIFFELHKPKQGFKAYFRPKSGFQSPF